MRQILKRLTKMIAGYGTIQWAGPFLSFFFTPIITRLLTPEDYGIADYITTVSTAIATLALFALPQAVAAHFNDQQDTTWQSQLAGSAFTITAVTGVIVGAAIYLAAPLLAESAPITHGYAYLFRLIGVTLVFGLCGAALSSVAQAALQVRWGMLLSVTAILFTVFGNVFYIVILRLGVTGMLLTPVTLSLATFTVGLLLSRRMIGAPSRKMVKLLLKTAAALAPAALAAWGLLVADRLILAQYVSAEALGHYAIANKIASLLYVLIAPIFTAYTALALSMQHEPLAKERYANLSRYLIAVVLFAGLGLGLYAPEILTIFTRAPYLPAAPYVGLLAYMHIFGAINAILYTGGLAGKQFGVITWTAIVGVAVNLAINFALVPSWGLWGATFATFISYAVSPVLLYFWLRRRYSVPYPLVRITGAVAIQIGLLVLGQSMPALPFLAGAGLKLVILLLLSVSFILLRMITPYEIEQTLLFIRARLANRKSMIKR